MNINPVPEIALMMVEQASCGSTHAISKNKDKTISAQPTTQSESDLCFAALLIKTYYAMTNVDISPFSSAVVVNATGARAFLGLTLAYATAWPS
jgi:hypothetical protein